MKNKKDKTVRVCLVQGVEGPSCYINDHRVCGNKPWGGGRTLFDKDISINEVIKAIGIEQLKEFYPPQPLSEDVVKSVLQEYDKWNYEQWHCDVNEKCSFYEWYLKHREL